MSEWYCKSSIVYASSNRCFLLFQSFGNRTRTYLWGWDRISLCWVNFSSPMVKLTLLLSTPTSILTSAHSSIQHLFICTPIMHSSWLSGKSRDGGTWASAAVAFPTSQPPSPPQLPLQHTALPTYNGHSGWSALCHSTLPPTTLDRTHHCIRWCCWTRWGTRRHGEYPLSNSLGILSSSPLLTSCWSWTSWHLTSQTLTSPAPRRASSCLLFAGTSEWICWT